MRILPGLKVQETTIRAAAPIVVAALIATSPMAAVAGDAKKGIDIFDANCAACHAGGQNVIMPEKTLQKDALVSYLAGGMKESSVVSQVTNGKNAMPAFGGRLEDEDIADVAAYVINQATNDLWE